MRNEEVFTLRRKTTGMLNINDYGYDLPAEKIALYPLARRDESKLLVYRGGEISHRHFYDLPSFLPENSFLFFNDTRVIPARLHFKKDTGAGIEIFLLHPVTPSPVLAVTMSATDTCTWKCTIGNVKRWPQGTVLIKNLDDDQLRATLIDKEEGIVRFDWSSALSFAAIITRSGETPLPPYLKRKAEPADQERYQTIYSHHEGAVAAPTAGLHFTPEVFRSLEEKKIAHDFITLHVSAGTFQPVKTEDANEHTMHEEQIVISRSNIDNLLNPDRSIIAVGTTSMRTLESLYWIGVKLLRNAHAELRISQNDPYEAEVSIPYKDALHALLQRMDREEKDSIIAETAIYIKPGYRFRICRGLITNFHQPASTLMLLVAAFVGQDWKKIYREALENNYRFLSYGDSSLLLP